MKINLPVAVNISMAERTLQELGSPDGKTVHKSDGLPSPERSGSPELNIRSSQWKRDRIAYASKEDAHQIDDWPEPAHNNRKSENVLVRYKDTRGSKMLSTRMDPHGWSDFPTDTDDEVADNATSPVWNGNHDAGLELKDTVPRERGCMRTQLELVNCQYFATEERWETVALDGEKGVVPTSTAIATSQNNGTRSFSHEVERDAARSESRVPTLRGVRSSSQKVLDDQASVKMSHRYYTSGQESTRRRSTSSRVPAKVENNMKPRKSNHKYNNDSNSVTDSSSPDCSDAENGKSSNRNVDDYNDESFREMILQKYLVMLPSNAKKQSLRGSSDRSCKSQACTEEPAHCNRLHGNKHALSSISVSRRQKFQLRKSPSTKKPSYPFLSSTGAPRNTRLSVSQPEENLQLVNKRAAAEAITAPLKEESDSGKSSSRVVAVLKKSFSTGDLSHSKSLGDIGTLKGHALTHRDSNSSLAQVKRTHLEESSRNGDNTRSFSAKDKREEKTSDHLGQNCFTDADMCIESVEASTTDLLLSDEGGGPCGCLNSPSSRPLLSKSRPSSGEVMEGADHYQRQEQGLSALALFHDPADSMHDPPAPPFVGLPAGGHWSHDNPVAIDQVIQGAGDSIDGGSTHRAKESQSKIGVAKQKSFIKKVTAVVPFGSCGDDQVLPYVSLTGQPASHTLVELEHEVEFSSHERRQQLRKQETYWGTEKLAQQKKGFWDASQELQKEKQNLLKRLQELEAHHPCNRLKAMSGTKVHLTEEDAKKLRQEILEQEALIRGYQVENEKAVAKLKEVQLEAKQKLQEMAEEKAHLASQLINRQMLGYGTTAESTSLHEKLQGALSRETALRIDLDKMRESYMELEKRVKREESGRVKDLELKLTSLQETLEAERQNHAQMEGRKQAMIQQEELIASLQETISDQASNIRSFTSRLEAGEEQHKKETQLIESLQNQVKGLEASLRSSKKETGLHTLQAVKYGMEENETFRRLQAELMAVQRNALEREEETNRIIHHQKAENEKIKQDFAARIRNLNQQIHTHSKNWQPVSESERSAVHRVKDLEKQVANLRIHYSRKVKELMDKLEETKRVEVNITRSKADNVGPPSRVTTTRLQPAQGKALREAKERIALQEDVISQKDRTIKNLQKRILAMESNGAGPAIPNSEPGEKRVKNIVQQQQCSNSNGSHDQRSPHKVVNGDAAAAEEVAVLRRELQKSELTREVLQKTCNESVEKTVLLTLQHQQALQLQQMRQSQPNHHHQQQCPGSECQPSSTGWPDHRNGMDGVHLLSERSSLEMANRALEARLKVMAEELEEANTMCQQSPRMTQIMNLKKKVAEMEARQQQKEKEWQRILQETKQTVSCREQDYAEEALYSKSMEVEKIRLELNTILEAAMAMQHAQQLQMNHKH